jgi:hypothetical protein
MKSQSRRVNVRPKVITWLQNCKKPVTDWASNKVAVPVVSRESTR